MDVDELIDDGQENIQGVDNILLTWRATVVKELKKSVQTITEKETKNKTCN